MTQALGKSKSEYVRAMFAQIAHGYDRMNHLMTAGQDLRWRQRVIALADLKAGDIVLDLGAGTGDLAREAIRQQPRAHLVAGDFTLEMMRAGQGHAPLNWCAADALALPFQNSGFDVAVSGFLMRNVAGVQQALREQLRILKPGGRIVILDTTRPRRSIISPLIWVHMHVVIPLLGALLSSPAAYRYLPNSTEAFLSAEELSECLRVAGFAHVKHELHGFGTIAIHSAEVSDP